MSFVQAKVVAEATGESGGGGGLSADTLTITNNPTKTSYFVGDTLDLTGLAVSATVGELSGDVTADCKISPASGTVLDKAGAQTITVSYGGMKQTCTVTAYAVDEIAVTTAPNKTSYQPGAILDLTGLVITGYANNRALSKNVTNSCTFNPANGTVLTEEGDVTVTVTYDSLSTSFNVTCASWDTNVMENNSWAAIYAHILNGTLPSAFLGQTKAITMSDDEIIEMQLVSINDGTGTTGQWYPNKTADFVCRNVMNDLHSMNDTATNVGGWKDCTMRTYLNTTVYEKLPVEIKDKLVEKTNAYTIGNLSKDVVSVTDKLWLPTLYEAANWIDQGDTTSNNKSYTTALSQDKHYRGGSSNTSWLTSTPNVSSTTGYKTVEGPGSVSGTSASNLKGVAFGFRLG